MEKSSSGEWGEEWIGHHGAGHGRDVGALTMAPDPLCDRILRLLGEFPTSRAESNQRRGEPQVDIRCRSSHDAKH